LKAGHLLDDDLRVAREFDRHVHISSSGANLSRIMLPMRKTLKRWWFWLIALAVISASLVVSYVRNSLAEATFSELRIGMSQEEVDRVVYGAVSSPLPGRSFTLPHVPRLWKRRDCLWVQFEGDPPRVVSLQMKDYRDERSFLPRIRDEYDFHRTRLKAIFSRK
jgi:hypothetical protein